MTNLIALVLQGNQLTNLTLPPDLTKLSTLFLNGNPFTTLVLSEQMAVTNLAATVASLRTQGVSVFTYPLAIRLTSPGRTGGAFRFTLTGPPGLYSVLASTNLVNWSAASTLTNALGTAAFTESAPLAQQKFYRARQ
jgi:Leucine-rich repeat (LRR) protein